MRKLSIKSALFIISGLYLVSCQQKAIPNTVEAREPREITKLSSSNLQTQFSPDGKSILIADIENKQLKIFDKETEEVELLETEVSGNSTAQFTANGNIFYITSDFSDRIRKSDLILYNRNNKTRKALLEGVRHLKIASTNKSSDFITIYAKDQFSIYNAESGEAIQEVKDLTAVVIDEKLDLVVFQNGESQIINPMGDGDYLWASLSPGSDKILFSVAGMGSFITDLQGESKIDLGRIHAPKWGNDGEWVIGMDDKDDGKMYTSSDIIMVSADGKTRKNLTEGTNIIALNPTISPDGNSVVFNDEEGSIYTMKIK